MHGTLTQMGVYASFPLAEKWFGMVIATALPLAFLVQLLWSEVALARRRIGLSGKPPIDRRLFFACKYLAIGAWFAVTLQSFGIGWQPLTGFRVPPAVSWALWVFGFGLLFFGRINLSTHFRLGLPNEATRFRRNGAFRFTREEFVKEAAIDGMYTHFIVNVLERPWSDYPNGATTWPPGTDLLAAIANGADMVHGLKEPLTR